VDTSAVFTLGPSDQLFACNPCVSASTVNMTHRRRACASLVWVFPRHYVCEILYSLFFILCSFRFESFRNYLLQRHHVRLISWVDISMDAHSLASMNVILTVSILLTRTSENCPKRGIIFADVRCYPQHNPTSASLSNSLARQHRMYDD